MASKSPLLKVDAVAERLALSVSHTYFLIDSGEIEAVRLGKHAIRVSEDAVEAYIARKTQPATRTRRVARTGT